MARDFVQPIFNAATEIEDWLTFLSRLWGISITTKELDEYQAYKLISPTRLSKTEDQYWGEKRLWDSERYANPAFYAFGKWYSYPFLGKSQSQMIEYLSTRPNPNRNEGREAIGIHINIKYAFQVRTLDIDVDNDLLPLVQGIIW